MIESSLLTLLSVAIRNEPTRILCATLYLPTTCYIVVLYTSYDLLASFFTRPTLSGQVKMTKAYGLSASLLSKIQGKGRVFVAPRLHDRQQ